MGEDRKNHGEGDEIQQHESCQWSYFFQEASNRNMERDKRHRKVKDVQRREVPCIWLIKTGRVGLKVLLFGLT